MSKLDYQIKYLQDHRKSCAENGTNWYVVEAIDLAIQALHEKQEREWISVDGRLDEEDVRVLQII